jgi:hypothetical protein
LSINSLWCNVCSSAFAGAIPLICSIGERTDSSDSTHLGGFFTHFAARFAGEQIAGQFTCQSAGETPDGTTSQHLA